MRIADIDAARGARTAASANVVWAQLLSDILFHGSTSKPRGLSIRELLAHKTVTAMTAPVVTYPKRKLGHKFLAAEAWWILSGKNDVASIKKYSPHIASFSDDGVRFDGAYGPKIIDQLRYVIDSLTADHDSRQSVIEIWRPNPRRSKDVPCTLSIQFVIRGQYLHCIDTMRSSDAWLGWPYDVFNFSMLSAYVALSLRHVPGLETLQLGNLYLTAGSSHLYLDPKAEGNGNIPYDVKVVYDLLKTKTELSFYAINYDPFDLTCLESPDHLLVILEVLKDGGKIDLPFFKDIWA